MYAHLNVHLNKSKYKYLPVDSNWSAPVHGVEVCLVPECLESLLGGLVVPLAKTQLCGVNSGNKATVARDGRLSGGSMVL